MFIEVPCVVWWEDSSVLMVINTEHISTVTKGEEGVTIITMINSDNKVYVDIPYTDFVKTRIQFNTISTPTRR